MPDARLILKLEGNMKMRRLDFDFRLDRMNGISLGTAHLQSSKVGV